MSFNMSGLYKYQDGSYKDINGNIVGYWSGRQSGLTKNAWNYLNSKYGKNWANRVSNNMKQGYIYEDNEWRYDGNSLFGKMKNIVGSPGIEQNDISRIKGIKSENKDKIQDDDDYATRLLKNVGLDSTAANVGSFGLYAVPIAGNILSILDAKKNIEDGNYGQAALNALMALPGLHEAKLVTKGINFGGKALKAAGVANKLSKGVKLSPKRANQFKLLGNISNGTILGLMGLVGTGAALQYVPQIYDHYQNILEDKKEIPMMLANQGQLNPYGRAALKAVSTSNTFLGDLKAAYNLTALDNDDQYEQYIE